MSGAMTLEEEEVAYYYELGRALAEWAHVERALFCVLAECFPISAHAKLGMGYVAIEGSRAKLRFVDHAVTRALVKSKPRTARWKKLQERMSSLTSTRNKLAHNPTRVFNSYKEGRRLALVPWAAPKNSPKDRPTSDSLCITEILKATVDFTKIRLDLLSFSQKINREPRLWPRFPTPFECSGDGVAAVLRIHQRLGHPPNLSAAERRRLKSEANTKAGMNVGASD
jgi:hypothetical protein